MKKLIDNEVDIGIGLISLQYVRSLFLSETKPYASIALAIVVPPGKMIFINVYVETYEHGNYISPQQETNMAS